MKIIFFGSTDFSTYILDSIVNQNYNVISVVTIPDKLSGRGLKKTFSPVKEYALSKNINIQQPDNLKDSDFIRNLVQFKADIFVVVAFRFIPKQIWTIAPTFNLHASLLPQYRGAAPIERAIMNGDTQTGVTTFFLQNKIDTGDIILQSKVLINETDDSGSLREKLSKEGAKLVIETLRKIQEDSIHTTKQTDIINTINSSELKYAHKLDKKDFFIDWDNTSYNIYNQIRALSPYPGAYTILSNNMVLKIFKAEKLIQDHNYKPGEVLLQNKNTLCFSTKDGFILPQELQIEGKKRMAIKEFMNGYSKLLFNSK